VVAGVLSLRPNRPPQGQDLGLTVATETRPAACWLGSTNTMLPWAASEPAACLLDALNRLAWQADVPCGVERANAICRRCLCQRECLDYSLAEDTFVGVWGATTPEERRGMRLTPTGP
jgi:hypothetical protein